MANFRSVWNANTKLPLLDADQHYNANFKEVWGSTKGFEGGFQAMPADVANYCPAKGKPGSQLIGTNHGISAIGYANYMKRCPTVSEMKNLSESKAQEIAKAQYWDPIKADKIKSQPVAHLIFDFTYGSGSYGPEQVRKAINTIKGKDTVKVFKSFKLNDNEIDLVNSIPEKKLFMELYNQRLQWYKGQTYEKGLTNRLNKMLTMYQGVLEDAVKVPSRHWGKLLIIGSAVGIGLFLLLYQKEKK